MAHHGITPFEGGQSLDSFHEQFKKAMPMEQSNRIEDLLKSNPMPNLGATGKFPDGKLNENDEGEIMVGITNAEDRVILNFGKPVHWIGFTKEQAKAIAHSLQFRAGFSTWDWMKKWLDAYDKSNGTDLANSIMNWCSSQPTTNSSI